MIALITGASSGIGKEMAYYLSDLGYDLILVARRKERLKEIQKKCKTKVTIYEMDVEIEKKLYELHQKVKNQNIDLLINNAGFGLFGDFDQTDLSRELEMINCNIKAYHILTKLFLQDFVKRDYGRILNVASAAGFLAGPRLSTYYATKNYVAKLSMGIYEELKHQKSNVHISILCPGPVKTEFNKVAHGKFSIKEMSSNDVAKYGIDKALKNKLIIIPGLSTKISLFLNRFVPWKVSLAITYQIEKRKN